MILLPGVSSQQIRQTIRLSLSGAILSCIGALWFSRAYYLNSDHVGWGDSAADRNQSIYWWVTVICVAVSLLLILLSAVRSERVRFAVLGASALTGSLMVIRWPTLRYAAISLIPGLFATVIAFGVHSGPRTWIRFLWVFGINTVFYTTIIGGIDALSKGRAHARARS